MTIHKVLTVTPGALLRSRNNDIMSSLEGITALAFYMSARACLRVLLPVQKIVHRQGKVTDAREMIMEVSEVTVLSTV